LIARLNWLKTRVWLRFALVKLLMALVHLKDNL
jgi:hypothetical protein